MKQRDNNLVYCFPLCISDLKRVSVARWWQTSDNFCKLDCMLCGQLLVVVVVHSMVFHTATQSDTDSPSLGCISTCFPENVQKTLRLRMSCLFYLQNSNGMSKFLPLSKHSWNEWCPFTFAACNPGTWGFNCNETCRCLNGKCDRFSGQCTCNDGWMGTHCTQGNCDIVQYAAHARSIGGCMLDISASVSGKRCCMQPVIANRPGRRGIMCSICIAASVTGSMKVLYPIARNVRGRRDSKILSAFVVKITNTRALCHILL